MKVRRRVDARDGRDGVDSVDDPVDGIAGRGRLRSESLSRQG